MMGMKYKEVAAADVAGLLVDDQWVVEQKMDGTRVLAEVNDGAVRFLHGAGGLLGHTAATQHSARVVAALAPLVEQTRGGGALVLDGELIVGTGEYHLFDLPYARFGHRVVVEPDDPQWARRAALEALAAVLPAPVRLVREAAGTAAKEDLLQAVAAAGGEGVVFKDTGAPYEPGRRVTSVLKWKFVKTADLVVTAVDRPDPRHGSFSLAAYDDDGVLVLVGNTSAIGKPEVSVGDVVEVAYLYREEGGRLVQPRLLRLRPDKAPREATLSQFRPYSRLAV